MIDLGRYLHWEVIVPLYCDSLTEDECPNDLVHQGQLYDLFGEYADYIGKDQPPQQTFTSEIKAIGGR